MIAAKYKLKAVDTNTLPSIVLSENISFEIGDKLEIKDFKGSWIVTEKEPIEISSKIYLHELKRL